MTAPARPLLLLVDDDTAIVDTLTWAFAPDFEVLAAASRPAARALLQEAPRPFDAALIDLGLPPCPHQPDEGLALIGELLTAAPWLKIVVLSGQNAEASARHARARGAYDFQPKPTSPEQLRAILLRAAKLGWDERQRETATEHLLGDSPAMQQLRAQIAQLADVPFPLLIEGESGTGKELTARALHEAGARRNAPFVVLNCAAIAPNLIEATLFGHARGAFTGAANARSGFFEEAGEGTLFLDEIGELPLELQPKLLRVLESGDYQRIGETQTRQTAARILAATNRNLLNEVHAGRFRRDLFHRLSVLELVLPPLRELGNDRFVLLDHFLAELRNRTGLPAFCLSKDARQLWAAYGFPGNVRELRNIATRLLALRSGQIIERAVLAAELDLEEEEPGDPAAEPNPRGEMFPADFSLDEALRQTETRYIEAALQASHGSISGAARLLGINRTTLYGRLTALNIQYPHKQ
ncbi:MAG: sigma-54 dependent transcriptional regulator [Betaproteobacteria bacterium]|nr:sigma-54 dependent transcriptional regulator [Betaproteobacteria bacterium]